jgi:hypothetical protein
MGAAQGDDSREGGHQKNHMTNGRAKSSLKFTPQLSVARIVT